ncbi:hypothetical protein NQ317_010332 [Molorchus minor]|uniref:Uncharacterized protein n=1 Tax=Molorchus minor TaxID=1323400 RepID=A0ABQ9J4P1_9CUCU|nr:hypothetical protein NQ317_010332 [Molorchus minor]
MQRIGLTYLIIGMLEAIFTRRAESDEVLWYHDITTAWPQWVFCDLYSYYSYLCNISTRMCLVVVKDIWDLNCTGGIAGYIDREVFGSHMYIDHTLHILYETVKSFDPEGILGTLSSILTVYLGVQAGRILNTYQNVKDKVLRWIIWGFITGLLGGVLCGFSRDAGPIPINKRLWSLSFTLITAGMAFLIQAFLFVLVDILRKWGGRPFFYPGMNAIFLYLGHELMKNTFPFGWKTTTDTHAMHLFMNLWAHFYG